MAMMHYSGGCQCGAVRYAVDADLDRQIACNCSRCGRLGTILSFTPIDRFALVSGEDSLTEYKFNKNVIQHLFCKICGVESFARGKAPDGSTMAAINVRCLDGIDVHALEPTKYDGKNK